MWKLIIGALLILSSAVSCLRVPMALSEKKPDELAQQVQESGPRVVGDLDAEAVDLLIEEPGNYALLIDPEHKGSLRPEDLAFLSPDGERRPVTGGWGETEISSGEQRREMIGIAELEPGSWTLEHPGLTPEQQLTVLQLRIPQFAIDAMIGLGIGALLGLAGLTAIIFGIVEISRKRRAAAVVAYDDGYDD